jgi:signal transduction histidine kinase
VPTSDGLNSFDGKNFRRYYFRSLSGNCLQSNSMRNIVPDSAGNLWVGTDQGLLFLDRAKDELIQPLSGIFNYCDNAVLPLFCFDDSLAILTVNEGVVVINLKNSGIRRIPIHGKVSHLSISQPHPDEVWIGLFPNRILRVRLKQPGLIETKEFVTGSDHLDLFVKVIAFPGSLDQFLILAPVTIEHLNTKNGFKSKLDWKNMMLPDESRLLTGSTDRFGNIWLSTENEGILILDSTFLIKKRILPDYKIGSESEKSLNTTVIYHDRGGNTWIGTDGQGVIYINHSPPFLKSVKRISTMNKVIENPFIRCFVEDKEGNLWLGTFQQGVFHLDRSSGRWKQFLTGQYLSYPSYNDIYSIACIENNIILAGTSGGIIQYDNDADQFVPVDHKTLTGTIQKVPQIIEDYLGNVYVTVNRKVYQLQKKAGNWQYSASLLPGSGECEYIWISNKGIFFAFTLQGFYKLTGQGAVMTPFIWNGVAASIDVNAVVSDTDTTLWLATNKGLIKSDMEGIITNWLTDEDGLPNQYLYGLLKDGQGNFWISSNGGLSSFDPVKSKFHNYLPEDGVQSREFNSGAYYQNRDGIMYFGGIQGYNWFNPDSAAFEVSSTIVMLTGILINDQEYKTNTCPMALEFLALSYNENTVTFGFSAINYEKPGKTSLNYMLEGFDSEWIPAGQNNQARYPRLLPGRYTFKVQEIYSEKNPAAMATLTIDIKKPFWMLNSFLISTGITLIILLYLIVRYFSVLKMKKKIALLERQREIHSIKTRIASDLHDDIGSGLSKLAMMLDTTRLSSASESELQIKLESVSQKARQMGDQLRVIVWALQPHDDQLNGLLSYIRRQTSEFLEEHNLKFSIQISEDLPSTVISAEFRRNVYYAVREAVHNVVKHAGADHLEIFISTSEENLFISVIDDGMGFDPQAIHSFGNGIRIILKRVGDLGGKVSILSEPQNGTKIQMEFPFKTSKNTT